MVLINSLLGASLIIFFHQLSLTMIGRKYGIDLKTNHGFIVDGFSVIVSLLSGALAFWITYFRLSRFSTVELILNIILIWGLSVLTVTDYKKKLVPNKILLAIFGLWVMVVFIFLLMDLGNSLSMLMDSIIGGGIIGLMFLLSYVLSKGQLGAGDVKLAFLMGLYLMTSRALFAFLIGSVLCFAFSFIMVLLKRLTLKDQVPLVPFLAIGAFIVILIA